MFQCDDAVHRQDYGNLSRWLKSSPTISIRMRVWFSAFHSTAHTCTHQQRTRFYLLGAVQAYVAIDRGLVTFPNRSKPIQSKLKGSKLLAVWDFGISRYSCGILRCGCDRLLALYRCNSYSLARNHIYLSTKDKMQLPSPTHCPVCGAGLMNTELVQATIWPQSMLQYAPLPCMCVNRI